MTRRRRSTAAVASIILLVGLLGACADAPTDEPRPVDAGSATPAGDQPAAGSIVRVWFHRGETPAPVERRVTGDPLKGALQELVRGPTAAEDSALGSWFSAETAGVLRDVVVRDSGHVIVEFIDLPRLIPSASSSAGSAQLLTALDSTIFQFPEVRSAEYRLGGSCAAFWEWLQRGCRIVTRGE